MSSDNDRRDARLRDSRKESPDRWGKGGRHDSDAATETNRNDPQSIRCRVFIGNLPSEMSSKELKETFSQYGPVVGVSVHNNFGFVQFEDDKSADSSVAKEHGKVYYGKRVDVNLAGDRRKPNKMDDRPRDRDSRPPFPFRREREFDRDGRPFRRSPPRERPRFEDYDRFPSRFEPPFERRGRSPSPPPPRRMDDRPGYGRHDDYYMRDRYRDEPPHHREPYPRQSYDHRGDAFERDRRDPYDSPRGPYPDRRDDRYDRYDSYGRDYPRPDDYPGAAKRPRMDYNDRPEDSYSSSKTIEAPTDCVIVVMNKQQRGYAEMVERRLKALGLVVELHFHGTQPITELLDDVARRGVLYAIVITSQHEIHRSVTVNILHGNPQGKDQNLLARIKKHTEHRNMPLDDAMRLVGQNFDQYMQDLRERAKSSSTQESSNTKTTAPQEAAKSDITSLLSKAASGEDLSADQLTKLIDNLSKRQEQILGDSAAANGKGGVTVSQSSQPAVDPQSIAKQQADLQAKILSILNPGGGAKTGSMQNSGSLASQQTQGAVTAPASQGAAKPASLSTTVKPIFPLYPTQQKPAAPVASTAGSAVKAPVGTAATKPLYSTPSNQAYKTASPYRATAPANSYNAIATVAGNQAGSYQVSKPVSQNTYTSVSNQATAASASSAAYGVKASTGPASQSNWLQRISQQSSGTSAAIPVVSKVSPGGKAITTAVGSRPGVNSAPRAVTPTAVGGVRPMPTAGGQMRTPSPGLLGPPPVGTPRFRPSGVVRTPTSSGTPGVRMVAPRGPLPVGRGVVRTSSPAGLQGQTVASRGGAISVRGGVAGAGGTSATGRGSFATQATTPRGGSAQRGAVIVRGTPTPRGATRGVPATRGAPSTRGVPLARGVPLSRGAPATRGAPAPRGAPVSSSGARGTPVTRGTPYLRGAPTGRGTLATRGSPIGTITSNRGAPRGRPMMRGGPPYRGGGRGGY